MNVTEKAQQDLKGLTKDQLKALLKSIYANVPLIGPEEDDPLGEALIKAYEETAKEMLAQMYDKTENPAEIYLVPVGLDEYVWCDTPAPGEGMREEDATRYVREDLYDNLLKGYPDGMTPADVAKMKQANFELSAQVDQLQEKIFELQCFDVDVIRCLKTMAFDHNHAEIKRYQQLAKDCMDSISAGRKANEIKADAYWKGYVAGGDDFRSRINIPLEVVTKKANELIVNLYPDSKSAKKIRQAAKGGE